MQVLLLEHYLDEHCLLDEVVAMPMKLVEELVVHWLLAMHSASVDSQVWVPAEAQVVLPALQPLQRWLGDSSDSEQGCS